MSTCTQSSCASCFWLLQGYARLESARKLERAAHFLAIVEVFRKSLHGPAPANTCSGTLLCISQGRVGLALAFELLRKDLEQLAARLSEVKSSCHVILLNRLWASRET